MINDVRNSTGFANFAVAKKFKARAPYSSKFQPLKAEVEAVRKPEMIEPYSVEQTLHEFGEEQVEPNESNPENMPNAEPGIAALDESIAHVEPGEQSQLYSGTGSRAPSVAPEIDSNAEAHLDDDALVDTVVANISQKIDTSFTALETNIATAIEMRLGKALLSVFKQQLADETSQRLRKSIAEIVAERADAKVHILGPKELIELFQLQADENGEIEKMSFSVDQSITDLIVQIDDVSITSRFAELDDLVSELFE